VQLPLLPAPLPPLVGADGVALEMPVLTPTPMPRTNVAAARRVLLRDSAMVGLLQMLGAAHRRRDAAGRSRH
jgi:hypothetical protein